ncbi:hypothetical protein [Nocardia goodfellowii]|uniref:Sensor domain-containing protein n=1 Tax=Nocardia goodfellowii TaxID=882446 RepID=A0ABS4QPR7_9NOCA|nr:hypothetical protein [Nocardia goodfellowii]MBP2193717.1 hypothetical protein [Nocardia goodfellowii]
MIRGLGLLLAGVGLALTGCSADTPENKPVLPAFGPIVAAAPAGGEPITDSDVLLARLLDPADLPSGFTPSGASRSADLPLGDPPPTKPAGCEQVMTPIGEQRPEARAWNFIGYNGPNFSSIDIDAASYPSDQLGPAFAAVQQTLRGCTVYSGADADETAIEFQLGALEQPAAGDAAASYQLRTVSDGITLMTLVSVVQVGNTLAQIAVTAPDAVDPGVLTAVTAAQVRRLRGVAGP